VIVKVIFALSGTLFLAPFGRPHLYYAYSLVYIL